MSFILLRNNNPSDTDKEAVVSLPLSKSIAARVLLLSAISGEDFSGQLPECDDTHYLYKAIKQYNEASNKNKDEIYYLGSGATGLRFFIALAASTPGFRGEIQCSGQLRGRPLSPLIESLRQAGADIKCLGRDGYPPLYINGKQLSGGEYKIDTSFSSQFLSALLLTAPMRDSATSFDLSTDTVSRPYIEMTLKLMQQFSADIDISRSITGYAEKITVNNKYYSKPNKFDIEPDWSAASYFYALALVRGASGYDSKIRIKKLTSPRQSIQGDAFCANIFNFLGVETSYLEDGGAILSTNSRAIKALQQSKIPVELDMGNYPDLVPAMSVALCLSNIRFSFANVAHLRVKESDRLLALSTELEKIGYRMEVNGDSICWHGRYYPSSDDATIQTYGDHRIAMSFAPAVYKTGYIAISDPEVVEKSFPDFWEQFEQLLPTL